MYTATSGGLKCSLAFTAWWEIKVGQAGHNISRQKGAAEHVWVMYMSWESASVLMSGSTCWALYVARAAVDSHVVIR